ncbi:MAG TPA: hypothetical protein VN748_15650 [Pseudonocardiaceae bacterium]|jgi:hypothetical protein|nr:hypothetical protein [Pseudonocardiaceae bacterium]
MGAGIPDQRGPAPQRHPPDTPERCCDALGPGQITDDHLRAEPAQRDHAIIVTTDHHAN